MAVGGTISSLVSWGGLFLAYAGSGAAITIVLIATSRRLSGELSSDPNSRVVKPYIELLSHLPSLKAYLIVFFEGMLILGSFSYLGAAISNTFNYSYITIGAITTAFGIGAILAGRLGGRIVKRTGKKRLIAFGLLFGAVADLLMATLSASLMSTIIGVFLLGLGFMLAHSTLLTLATEFAKKSRGIAMSLVAFSFMVGGAVGTGLGGGYINAYGYESFFLICSVLLVTLGLIAYIAISEGALLKEEEELAM